MSRLDREACETPRPRSSRPVPTFRGVAQSSCLVSFSPRGIMGTAIPSLELEGQELRLQGGPAGPGASVPGYCSCYRCHTSPDSGTHAPPRAVLDHVPPNVRRGRLGVRRRVHPPSGEHAHSPLRLLGIGVAIEPLQLLLQQLQAGVDVAQLQGHGLSDLGIAGGPGGSQAQVKPQLCRWTPAPAWAPEPTPRVTSQRAQTLRGTAAGSGVQDSPDDLTLL